MRIIRVRLLVIVVSMATDRGPNEIGPFALHSLDQIAEANNRAGSRVPAGFL